MTGILLLAIMVMGAILYDTRKRLERLEQAAGVKQGATGQWPLPPAAKAAPKPLQRDLPPEPVPAPVEKVPEPPVAIPAIESAPDPIPAAVETKKIRQAKPSGFGFEDLFGRKLPIWAGGVTLIVAAVLMVKYSIDTGLLSPLVRVVLGFFFSLGLIGGGELARRREHVVRDARVAQALAGAGIGGLYAATLAAANLYGLMGPGLAFVGLTAITALALALAIRFGAPCAILGLVGGLATPAVVQSDSPSVPLLAGYLAVVIGAITLLSRRQRWVWLGVSALVGGAGWSLLTILLGGLDSASTLSMGLLVMLLGLGLPALGIVQGRTAPLLRVTGAVVSALQLALLVANGDFAPLTWGLYGLLSGAFLWLADRTPPLRSAAPVPLLTALGLAAVWPAPGMGLFTAVIVGMTLLYGGYALRHLWRGEGGFIETGLLAAIALGGYGISFAKFHVGAVGQDLTFALLALVFGAVPALGAALGWRRSERHGDARFALLSCCAGLLAVIAGLVGLPEWAAPIVIAAVAGGLLALSQAADDQRLAKGALGFMICAIVALTLTPGAEAEMTRLFDGIALPPVGHALLRWGALASLAAAFAWRGGGPRLRSGMQAVAALLGYGFIAQIVPAPWLAVALAVGLALLAEVEARKAALRLDPALGMIAALMTLWAVEPLAHWMLSGLLSLAGELVLVGDLPEPGVAMQRLAVPAVALAFVLWRKGSALREMVRIAGMGLAGALTLASAHILYKQLFAIDTQAAFVSYGLVERCLWEALLVGAGLIAWRRVAARNIALGLMAAGLAHGIVYTLALHDPLWARQAVGGWPLVNLLLPAFGIVFAIPMLMERIAPDLLQRIRRAVDGLRMVVILLFAFATLRQLFAGSLAVAGEVGAVENIGRSVLAIALAMGFLGWGIRRGLRDWRIASLVVMLAAVGKVFLLDASGLEGLLRILSFMALGFSLIGIGWLYSRYLRPDAG